MYFARKVDEYLDEWLKGKQTMPLLLVGIRQCDKTETIREFARRNNMQLIEINFWTNPEYCSDFSGNLDVDNIISNISLRFPNIVINPNNCIIFLNVSEEGDIITIPHYLTFALGKIKHDF
ncbi:MAG: hypothetical protein ACI4WG_03720 [Erysipelotrichaceae bacterium]